MENLTIDTILNAKFELKKEPILHPFDASFVCADPSLLTPDKAIDNMWHLFFHTHFGVYHFISKDGIKFDKVSKIVKDAMRPNINYIDGKYYLFFEKTRPVFINLLTLIGLAKWRSSIHCLESKDLINWENETEVISHTKSYEKIAKVGDYSISNPFYANIDGKHRLYYSCGLTYIEDCKFSEPTFISYAESDSIINGYKSIENPIIKPNKEDPYLNLCSGCLKVYKLKDSFIGIQNGIYEKDNKSHSAIILFSSKDGITFKEEKVLLEPTTSSPKWMKQFVYASHLVLYKDTLRLYFNGRDTANPIKGRECLGFLEAKL